MLSTESNVYALMSGVIGASGSALGKLSGYFESWIVSLAILGVMVFVNSVSFTMYAKSLSTSETTLAPTLLSTGTSFVASAVIGSSLFNEPTPPLWWLGACLVLCGIFVLSLPNIKPTEETTRKND